MTAKKHKRQSKRATRVVTWVVLVAALLVLASAFVLYFAVAQKHSVAYQGEMKDMSTGLIGQYAALIVIAQQQGYFRDNGLNVRIVQYDSGPAALADMYAGKVDTAMGADFAAALDGLKGQDIKILATVSKSEAFYLVVRTDHGIRSVGDLRGKRVGITHKTVGEFYLGQFLIFNNLTFGDIRTADMGQSGLIDALAAGTIDAAVLFEPNAYNAKKRIGQVTENWPVQTGQKIYSSLYGTGRLVQNRPEDLKCYMRALVQAEDFVRDHSAEAQRIVGGYFGYSDEYLRYIWPKFTFTVSLDQELLINMDDEARWAIENNLTTAKVLPNYFRLVHLDALESVKPEGITVIY